VLGETKVPGQARHPVTLTQDTLDDTLALKVRPVRAALPGAKLPAYLRSAGGGVSTMQPVTRADLAAVEAVHPDLILGDSSNDGKSGNGPLYDRLSRIAPTVMIATGSDQWRLNVRLVGEGLGRTNDAEQLLIDYDHEAFLARKAIRAARHGSAKPSVAVALETPAGLRFATKRSFAGTLLSDAGVKQVNNPSAADVTLLATAPGVAGKLDGHFVPVSSAVWFGPGGALAAKAALDELVAALKR
jgi:iron complex transport system substrate-binding protein